jgi:hypothetical protein
MRSPSYITGLTLWFTKASRIAVVMARGAYWSGERKRLLVLLGAETLEQLKRGSLEPAKLAVFADQIDRIRERLEAEETLIREIRFGGNHEHRMDGGTNTLS